MKSQTPTARLVKIIRKNERVRVNNERKGNGELQQSLTKKISARHIFTG